MTPDDKKAVPSPARKLAAAEAQDSGGTAVLGPLGPALGEMCVGVVTDTHHPEAPGRVCVSWETSGAQLQHAWLPRNNAMRFEPGMQVMLMRASNWDEWIVAFPFGGPSSPVDARVTPARNNNAQSQRESAVTVAGLDSLELENEQGRSLGALRQDAQGRTVLRLPQDVTMVSSGVLRLEGERLEFRSREGGTDMRSEGDTVVRGRKIELN